MPQEEQKLVAAMTPTGGYKNYPPYINVRRSGVYGQMVTVTLRGSETPEGIGAHAEAIFTRQDFALFLLEACREL